MHGLIRKDKTKRPNITSQLNSSSPSTQQPRLDLAGLGGAAGLDYEQSRYCVLRAVYATDWPKALGRVET